MTARLSWNVIADVEQMWVYPFMVTAFRAGTVVAVLAGVVGWIMVLRKESFAGHTLAIVGFPEPLPRRGWASPPGTATSPPVSAPPR